MTPRQIRTEAWHLFRLAWPVIVTQIGIMLMMVVDTIMLGRYSSDALAAVASASVMQHIAFVVPFGILMGLDPVVSQAWGAGDRAAVGRTHRRGLFIAMALSIPLMVTWMLLGEFMRITSQPAHLVASGAWYGLASVPGAWPMLAFCALRNTLQGIGVVVPVALVMLAANVLNVFTNLLLIFGWPALGIPEMGVIGAGLSTSIARVAMFLMLWWVAARGGWLRQIQPEGTWRLLEWKAMRRILAVGLPVGLHFGVESAVFGGLTIMIGWIGATALAGHIIAINLASLSFMLPMGISIAAGVRVGHGIGARNPDQARRTAVVAVVGAGAVMLVPTALFALIPATLGAIYTVDPEVIAMVVLLLPMAAAFQLFDGLQVLGYGVLRGTGDTTVPAILGLAGYLTIALPLGYWLAFPMGAGAIGVWSGIVVGLAVVAIVVLLRMRHRMTGDLQPLEDHPAPGDEATGTEPETAKAVSLPSAHAEPSAVPVAAPAPA